MPQLRVNLAAFLVLATSASAVPIAFAAPDHPPPATPVENPAAALDQIPAPTDDYALADAAWVAQAHQVWLVADYDARADAAARAAAIPVPKPAPSPNATTVVESPPPMSYSLTDLQLYRLRMCESTDNYTINTGNGFYGAYQFNTMTWDGVASRWDPQWVGVLPSNAPPGVQDALTRALWSERGRAPWPVCGLRV